MNLKEELTEVCPVVFTPAAVLEIKKLLIAEESTEGRGLRVGVRGGGCSGMTYVLGFDTKDGNDEEYLIEGIRILMNPSHQLYLFGMEIDFQSGLNARGFLFNNPNAKTTCGCGTSFSS